MLDYKLNPEKTALVFIDCQYDFINEALGTPEAIIALDNVVNLATAPVTYMCATQDTHNDTYLTTREGQRLPVPHTIAGEHGWQIADPLRNILDNHDTHTTRKFQKETFGSNDLVTYLTNLVQNQDINTIIFCGFCTDICVISNVLATQLATNNTIDIVVVQDACAGVTPEKHLAALNVMNSCQIDIATTENILTALTQDEE